MILQVSDFNDQLERIMYKLEFGKWCYENKVYFEQFLNLRQGDSTIDEYIDQFSKLQCLCKLKSKTRDFNHFLRVLRLDILENMNPCKDIFEACREVIRVEYTMERSRL